MKRIILVLLVGLAPVLFSAVVSAAVLKVGPLKPYKRPSEAAKVAKDGDTIKIDAGTYNGDVAIWRQNNLTLTGVGGRALIKAAGKAAQGKGIWVIKGDNATVENIGFSGARVADKNGAGIRLEGKNVIIRNCFFYNNENGILGGAGTVLVEYSEFSNNGAGDGYSHNIYISRRAEQFTLQHSYSHHAKVGHNVKSRARENFILYNRLMDENTGNSSYIIDLPNGGSAYVIGNLIQQGPLMENFTLLSYGAERLRPSGEGLFVVNNTFVNEFSGGRFIRIGKRGKTATVFNNIFAGPGMIAMGSAELSHNVVSNDPGFVNPKDFDYRLKAGSAAIDAGKDPGTAGGVDLTPRYQYVHPHGREPRIRRGPMDAGAYEYKSEEPAS